MLLAPLLILAQTASPAPPTYSADVAPLMTRSCVECHRPDGVGLFPLMTYEQVRRRGRQIATVTASRFMPPWLPSTHGVALDGARRLADSEVKMLERWVAADMPRGDLVPDPPSTGLESGWRLGTPDLVLTMPEPVVIPADGADLLRTIVLATGLESDRFVRAFEFRASNARTVHHVAFLVDDTGMSREFDAGDPDVGYPAMGSVGLNLAGSFGSWAPGASSTMPDDAIQVIPAGADLSLEMHFKPTGRIEREQSQVALYFTDDPPASRAVTFSLADLRLDIAPGEADVQLHDEFSVPVDLRLIAVAPYGRYICRSIRVTATLPDADETTLTLLDTPEWNFTFQEPYRFDEPVCLPAGSTISMHYAFDNSANNPRNPADPPVQVRLGHDPTDELALIMLYAVPDDPADASVLEDAHRNAILERIERRRAWIRSRTRRTP